MILIKNHEDKQLLRKAEAQTIVTLLPDIQVPKGSFVINMSGPPALWRAALFSRAEELGHHFQQTFPYSYPLYYIMRVEADREGAMRW